MLIYFDKLYKTQFGGAINILKACIIDAKFGLLTQKYMPGIKLNINQQQAKLQIKGVMKLVIEINASKGVKNDIEFDYYKTQIEKPNVLELQYLHL